MYMRRARAALPLAVAAILACDGVDRIQAPRLTLLEARAGLTLQVAQLDVRAMLAGEILPRSPFWDRWSEPGPACHYEIMETGEIYPCGEVAVAPPGEYTVAVYSYDRPVATGTVTLTLGQTTVREYDFAPHLAYISGRLFVNGESGAGRWLCADAGFRWICDAVGADGSFRILAVPGKGQLLIPEAEGSAIAYDAPQSINLGDVQMQTAAARISLLFNGQEVDPRLLGLHTCSVSLSRTGSFRGGLPCNATFDAPSGEWQYSMVWLGLTIDNKALTLTTGSTLRQSYDMTNKTGIISGKLVFNGESPGAHQVCLRASSGKQVCVTSQADGSFEIFLPAGKSEIDLPNGVTTFEVPAGQRTAMEFNSSVASIKVRATYLGQPLGAGTVPWACSVSLVRLDAAGTAHANCNNTMAVTTPGSYRVGANFFGIPVAQEEVTLATGTTVERAFEISAVAGVVAGRAIVNGVPLPADRFVCAWGDRVDFCVHPSADGEFSFLLPAEPGEIRIYGAEPVPFVAVAGQTIRVGDPEPGETPTGTNVSVSPTDETTGEPSPVEMTFSNVTGSGTTTVTSGTVGGSSGPPAPSNFRLGSPPTYYDIQTTATFDGMVRICISYAGVSVGNENQLKLLHYENGAWINVTAPGYPDTEQDVICGDVTSLSPFLVAELNAAPVVSAIALPADPIAVGNSASLVAQFSDANPRDSHAARIAWGDASSSDAAVTEQAGAGTVAASHAYGVAGVYTVDVTVSDGDLTGTRSSAQDLPAYVVVYDPEAGFVTGGGWIDSPAGAYAPDPTLAGRANFGFVSRYARGATVPSGNTEFHFKGAGFSFRSASYEWLVVSGTRAQFKGAGMINDTGDYGFMLTAVDGGTSSDRFRIKIWERATGTIIYDNEMSSTDTSDPSTVIRGGSIIVHAK